MEKMIPIFRVSEARATARWYERLGFRVTGEHQFGPEFPLYVFLSRGEEQLHLSEHTGDQKGPSLVYFWVEDVDVIAREFKVAVVQKPWAREIELVDPDGNRLRIGQVDSGATSAR